jgi:hypothetical protein
VMAAKLLSNNTLDAVFAMANDEEPHAYVSGAHSAPQLNKLAVRNGFLTFHSIHAKSLSYLIF